MEKEIAVAVIASSTAILVAVINMLSSKRISREQKLIQQEIENIKLTRDDRMSRTLKKSETHKEILSLMADQISLIQKLRDTIMRIDKKIANQDGGVIIIKRIEEICEIYHEKFEAMSGLADNSLSNSFHSAKHDVYNACKILSEFILNPSSQEFLSTKRAAEVRESLLETQNTIRDARALLLERYYNE